MLFPFSTIPENKEKENGRIFSHTSSNLFLSHILEKCVGWGMRPQILTGEGEPLKLFFTLFGVLCKWRDNYHYGEQWSTVFHHPGGKPDGEAVFRLSMSLGTINLGSTCQQTSCAQVSQESWSAICIPGKLQICLMGMSLGTRVDVKSHVIEHWLTLTFP